MQTHRTVFSLSALALLIGGAFAQGTTPGVPDPGTQDAWGPPTTAPFVKAHLINATSGHISVTSGTRTTRTRDVVACQQMGVAYCGGSGQIAAGAGLSLFGFDYTVDQTWTAPPADDCDLCAIFLCGNATETETTDKGKTRHKNGLGMTISKTDYGSGPTTSVVPDGTGFVLKQKCINSDEAHEFCCPDKSYAWTGGSSQALGSLEYGDIAINPERYGFGHDMPAPYSFDLLEVAAFVSLDLGSVLQNAEEVWEGDLANFGFYVASSIDETTLDQRMQLAEHLIQSLGLLNPLTPWPTGRIVLSAISPDGTVTGVDLGTVEELLANDTLRLANPADINMDFVVDAADLEIVYQDLQASYSGGRGDVNLDGWVTSADVELVQSAMGQ